MVSRTIFVISAVRLYSGDLPVPVAACFTSEAADAFVEACRKHDMAYPMSEPGEKFTAWLAKVKPWEKAHPAGAKNAKPDEWRIVEVPFH